MSRDAFVSYATPDRAVALELVGYLEARGLSCWIAPRDVPGGSKYAEVILGALSDADVFLLLFSKDSNASEHVQREVERALNSSKTIVPVRLADVYPTGSMDYYLATLHWIDAFGDARESAPEKAAQALAGVIGRELPAFEEDEVVGASAGVAAISMPIASPGMSPETRRRLLIGGLGAALVVLALVGLMVWQFGDRLGGDGVQAGNDGGSASQPDIDGDGRPGGDKAGAGTGQTGSGAASGSDKAPLVAAGTVSGVGVGAGDSEADDPKMAAPKAEPKPTPKPTPPPPPPPDPVETAIVAATEAWSANARDQALAEWQKVIELPAAEVDRERIGEEGIALLRELVTTAAADSAAADGAAQASFESLDSWRALVDFSERLGIDELAPQRERFGFCLQIAEAESQWSSGRREPAAQILATLGVQHDALVKDAESPPVKRLQALLDDVTREAAEGRLGAAQGLADNWKPALQLAAEAGNLEATTLVANMAWDSKDYETAAELLSTVEGSTRGLPDLDPMVEDLLKKLLRAAQSGDDEWRSEKWEPAYNLAYAHELQGSLRILAETVYNRNPADAELLFRQVYSQDSDGLSPIDRIELCNEMIKLYDRGAEGDFYRSEGQRACEDTLDTLAKVSGPPPQTEIKEIRKLAANGVAGAQHLMGNLLTSGAVEGAEPGSAPAEALDYYKQSAALGYADAKYALGECYLNGSGTARDPAEAQRVFASMTDEELKVVPLALFKLALLAEAQAPEKAEEYYLRARPLYQAKIDAGQTRFYAAELGYMLLAGKGANGEQDFAGSYDLLLKAVEIGEASAEHLVGNILYAEAGDYALIREDLKLDRDEERGRTLLKSAASQGYQPAISDCDTIGIPYDEG